MFSVLSVCHSVSPREGRGVPCDHTWTCSNVLTLKCPPLELFKVGHHTSIGKRAVGFLLKELLLLSNDEIALIKVHTYIVSFDYVYLKDSNLVFVRK